MLVSGPCVGKLLPAADAVGVPVMKWRRRMVFQCPSYPSQAEKFEEKTKR